MAVYNCGSNGKGKPFVKKRETEKAKGLKPHIQRTLKPKN